MFCWHHEILISTQVKKKPFSPILNKLYERIKLKKNNKQKKKVEPFPTHAMREKSFG
jgi:hypothetical protein